MRARSTILVPLLAVAMLLVASPLSGAARSAAKRACRAPRLAGLSLQTARLHAGHARCTLRLRGAALQQSSVQTIGRQSPAAGRRSSSVTVWLNPLCRGQAETGPGIQEPLVTTGPTELITGFYLDGGPQREFSQPQCKRPEPPPGPGTVEVMNASGATVATSTSTVGRSITIPLPAGSYTIRGTFLDAVVNGVHPTRTESVVIPAGHTVRRDFVLPIK